MKIYFDENFSRHLVAGMKAFQEGRRSEGVDVSWNPDEFGRGCPDEDWIPVVAQRHGVIVTQDTNIHRTKAQAELCRQNKVGIIFLKPPKKQDSGNWGYWPIIELIIRNWAEIKETAKEPRPFAYVIEPGKSKWTKLAA